MTTFDIELSRYPFFHKAFLSRKVVIVREGRGVVSSVGFSIHGGKPQFTVELLPSREPITIPWFLDDKRYQRFVARVGQSKTA
jgi:hypothetical protein